MRYCVQQCEISTWSTAIRHQREAHLALWEDSGELALQAVLERERLFQDFPVAARLGVVHLEVGRLGAVHLVAVRLVAARLEVVLPVVHLVEVYSALVLHRPEVMGEYSRLRLQELHHFVLLHQFLSISDLVDRPESDHFPPYR